MTPNLSRPIVVMQSEAAGAALIGELDMPLLLIGEHPDFARRLQQALTSATVGCRLYLLGDEAFLWRIHGEARAAGLEDDEINMTCTVPGLRQVYCAHCSLTQVAGPDPLLNCIGCHVELEVRTHFSRRLGAYLGVCINPDQPYAGFQP
ncbi:MULTISPECIES: dimethylamine monooxygenase subunit DmmA family protein [unclassified Pseudomonas]|uniref:dimethylamine monooxygenase subunit DmmA family protein n=1 Tax=unclassified Pseudomonas TaxID=196821 RepID=UPI0039B76E3D